MVEEKTNNCFFFQELGRKDDLISLFYMIVELWKGSLPWKDQKNHAEVAEAKQRCSIESLAKEIHPAFVRIANQTNSLEYESL